jgi:hypothetical protein
MSLLLCSLWFFLFLTPSFEIQRFLCLYFLLLNCSTFDVATLALGPRPRQGLAKVWAKSELGSHISCFGSVKECEGMNPYTPKWATNAATPLWDKCEGEAHTPKSGKLESSGTLKNSELEFRGQISSHSSVFYVIQKVLKFRCPKWPRMSHLDICSPSCGQKKGRESNWQFDSRPLKVRNRPLPDVCSRIATWHWKALNENYNFG